MGNNVAVNVLGTIGTVCWCIQLVPQIIRNYRVKDCEGLPPLMMFLWCASGIPFSIYFFGTDGSIPLRIQPQLFTFFCLVTFAQSIYYPPVQLPFRKVIFYVVSFVAIGIGLEVGLIIWLRPLYREGIHYPMLIVGIVASVLLAVGLFPPYFELAKRQGRVIGINFLFLSMDSLGALLSMLSVVVGDMDVMSMVLYAIVLALELGIFALHAIWWLRFGRKMSKQEKDLQEMEELEAERDSTSRLLGEEDNTSTGLSKGEADLSDIDDDKRTLEV